MIILKTAPLAISAELDCVGFKFADKGRVAMQKIAKEHPSPANRVLWYRCFLFWLTGDRGRK